MSSAAKPNLKKKEVARAVETCLRYWHRPDSLKRFLLIRNNLTEQQSAREKG